MKPIEMGAVRVKVKLTNAIDEAMVSRGVLAPHLLRECETQALVDTGALTLVVPPEIAEHWACEFWGNRLPDTQMG